MNDRKKNFLEIQEGIKKNISPNLNFLQKMFVHLDIHLEARMHGIIIEDYFLYGFYWKRQPERRKFICWREAKMILEVCNDPEKYYIFDQKPVFNALFSKYLGRKWLDTSQCSYEEFVDFIKETHRFFVKPGKGTYGIGAKIIEKTSEWDDRKKYEQYKKSKVLLEEVIKQHPSLEEFNSTSANTFRVVTFMKADGQVEVTAAVFRMGRKGKVVDNFHHDGLAALVDVDTGIVKSTALDRNNKRYVVHPDSGKPIVGFKVPNWKEVKTMVREAAFVAPDMRYVGWDVTIDKDGRPMIIEGNKSADHDVTQTPDNVGKWYVYKPLIDDLIKREKQRTRSTKR